MMPAFKNFIWAISSSKLLLLNSINIRPFLNSGSGSNLSAILAQTLSNSKSDKAYVTDCTHASAVRISISFIRRWKSPWSLRKDARSPKQ